VDLGVCDWDGSMGVGSIDEGVDDGEDDGRRKQVLVPSSIRIVSADPSASVYRHNESLNTKSR
jgi:hypothetical protein